MLQVSSLRILIRYLRVFLTTILDTILVYAVQLPRRVLSNLCVLLLSTSRPPPHTMHSLDAFIRHSAKQIVMCETRKPDLALWTGPESFSLAHPLIEMVLLMFIPQGETRCAQLFFIAV